MNLKYNKRFRKALSSMKVFLSNLGNSFMSFLYICILSSQKTARRCRKEQRGDKSRNCCVLGNGPSLKNAVEKGEVKYTDCDVVCVNMFCLSEYFSVIKPQYYFLTDLAYFAPKNERHKNLINNLIKKLSEVTWNMILVIPNIVPSGGKLLNQLNNDKISVLKINTTRVDGFKKLCHYYYNRQLAIPQCENILGVVLTKIVSWNYKTIYLYGADHSWTKDLYVDDNNVVCYGDRHVYDTNLSIIKMDHPLWVELRSFTIVFKAHIKIQEYAIAKGCTIYNCTKESFIDAYPRIR